MLIYDFIERRFDELDFDESERMVDALLNNNTKEFGQIDKDVDQICFELWQEISG